MAKETLKIRILYRILLFLLIYSYSSLAYGETVEYDLFIEYKTVNFTGKEVEAMTINGTIPGPTLYMREGDFVKVRVHNRMDVETSIHWHGLLVPNKEDGVPYLTTPPIKPGKMREFSFPIIQSGTYWYHSHTGLQEQRGLYGSIVIYPKDKNMQADREYVLVLSDWTDENPDEVLRTLKRGSDYYLLKKGTMQSLVGAIRADALKEMFERSLMRMPPMDISDVGYDLFLINGQKELSLPAKQGEKVLLRIINAAAETYFYLQFAGGSMNIVSADGIDIEQISLDRFLIAIAETYDVLLTMPSEEGAFEFRATAQNSTGYASAYLGSGKRIHAPEVPKPNLYKMDMGMNMEHGQEMKPMPDQHTMPMDMPVGHDGHEMKPQQKVHDMPSERPLAPYTLLRALRPTTLPKDRPVRTITLTLDGDMERYVWTINGKILSESDPIIIRRGENVRIVFENKSMMHHPMHLHGHFFRVLNAQGEYAPLKHTVDIPPMGKQIIEFYAGEDKDWALHCHILYHMKAGMFTVISYEGSEIDPEIAEARKDPDNDLKKDPYFFWGEASFLTQMSEGLLVASNTRNIFSALWEADWKRNYDIELTYDRYFNRFFTVFGGANITDDRTRGILGIRYLLPLNFESKLWVDTKGDFRVVLEKKIQVISRLSVAGEVEYDTGTQWEWVARAEWTINKYLSLFGDYHSDYKGGVGLTIRF
jgi:FtsP/CotA-like multicopper oxidase with cupredoxin domain